MLIGFWGTGLWQRVDAWPNFQRKMQYTSQHNEHLDVFDRLPSSSPKSGHPLFDMIVDAIESDIQVM